MKGDLPTLSLRTLVALAPLVVTVGLAVWNIGFCLGARSLPIPPAPNLQWGGPYGCGYGFTRVPIANWLGDAPEPVVCKAVSD